MSKKTPHQYAIPPPTVMKKEKPKTPTPTYPPMELLNSAMSDTWKFFTLGAFFGLFLFTLLLTTTPQSLLLSSSRSSLFSSSATATPPPVSYIMLTEPATNSTGVVNSTTTTATATDATNETSSYSSTASASAPQPAAEAEAVRVNSTTTTLTGATNETSSYSSTASASTPQLAAEAKAVRVNSTTTTTTPTPTGAANETSSYNSTELMEFLNSTGNTLEERLFTSSTTSSQEDQGVYSTTEAVAVAVPVVGPAEEAVNGSSGSKGGGQKCKMYEGRWVYKPEENPRYRVDQCPFLEEKMSCQKNGRPDFDYEAWSWESDDCQIPLFDGKDMLERMRGKRMIIVGDSLNRNKWESLACLLYTSISPKRARVDAGGPAYKVLKALDYGFTLEFYWAPFLVDYNPSHPSGRRVLTLDRLDPASKQWRGADVMVFNSGHWWTHDRGRFKPYDVFEYGGKQLDKMQTELAYERALATWASWLAHNVDPTKTKVYFRSISPEHKNKDWCFNHSRPIPDESYQQLYPRSMINVVENKLKEINGGEGVHVSYLNITKMSSYRRDAHPGIFRFKHWKIITTKYKRLIRDKSDCSHWCLPGLPDTWNRILYASLFFDHFTPGELGVS